MRIRFMVLDSSGILYLTDSLVQPDGIREISPGAAAAASLTASPASLPFNFTIGGTAPASQTLSVSIPASAVTFTALASTTSGANWLSVSPGSGTTPATLTVSVNPSGLAVNTYQGAVTLTPSSGSPLVVAVTLTVNGAGPSPGLVRASTRW